MEPKFDANIQLHQKRQAAEGHLDQATKELSQCVVNLRKTLELLPPESRGALRFDGVVHGVDELGTLIQPLRLGPAGQRCPLCKGKGKL